MPDPIAEYYTRKRELRLAIHKAQHAVLDAAVPAANIIDMLRPDQWDWSIIQAFIDAVREFEALEYHTLVALEKE